MGSRQSFATPHSRVPSAMIGQYTLKPDTHSNRDTGIKISRVIVVRARSGKIRVASRRCVTVPVAPPGGGGKILTPAFYVFSSALSRFFVR